MNAIPLAAVLGAGDTRGKETDYKSIDEVYEVQIHLIFHMLHTATYAMACYTSLNVCVWLYGAML